MKLALLVSAGLALSAADAANIYMLSSLDPATDAAATLALTSRGHTVTLGVDYPLFDGTINLNGFDTVYLQSNSNWIGGTMPEPGQLQIVNWVNAGGRLVTSEWVIYYSYIGGKFGTLGPIFPAEQTTSYGSAPLATFSTVTPDPVVNAGLPASFEVPLYSSAGTETFAVAKSSATTYYNTSSSPGVGALLGWAVGSGSVFSFTSTCGPTQVENATFGRLFANVMGAAGATCYANCDSSTIAPVLNVADFSCFLNAFAGGASYANCDNSTTAPVLNVADFSCFLNAFAAGCP